MKIKFFGFIISISISRIIKPTRSLSKKQIKVLWKEFKKVYPNMERTQKIECIKYFITLGENLFNYHISLHDTLILFKNEYPQYFIIEED